MSESIEVGAVSLSPTVHTVTIRGDVDIATSPRVREVVNQSLDENATNLIIDMRGVRYIDTSGMVVLVHALKRTRERKGGIAVVCVNPRICKFFAITGLQNVFTIFDSVDAAFKSFQSRAA